MVMKKLFIPTIIIIAAFITGFSVKLAVTSAHQTKSPATITQVKVVHDIVPQNVDSTKESTTSKPQSPQSAQTTQPSKTTQSTGVAATAPSSTPETKAQTAPTQSPAPVHQVDLPPNSTGHIVDIHTTN